MVKEIKSIGTITIDILENGGVNVNGSIKDPAMNMQIMGKALVALGIFASNQAKEKSAIVVPKPIIVPGH